MPLVNIINSSLIGLSLLIVFICIIVLSGQKPSAEQKYVNNVMVIVMLSIIGFLIYDKGGSEAELVTGIKFILLSGIIEFFVVFMIFQQEYDFPLPGPLKMVISLWVFVLIGLLVCANKDRSPAIFHWFFESWKAVKVSGRLHLTVTFAWGWTAYIITMVAILLSTIGIFGQMVIKARRNHYRISVAFFLIVSFPQLAMLVTLSLLRQKVFLPIVPLFDAVSSVVAVSMVVGQHFNNLYDLAYKAIVNSLQDPMFVLDRSLNVVSVNTAARVLYPEYNKVSTGNGQGIEAREELKQIIAPPVYREENEPATFKIAGNSYEPEVHKVERNNHFYGYVLVLNDVTLQHDKYARLETENNQLLQYIKDERKKVRLMREKQLSGALQFVMDRDSATAEHLRRCSNYVFVLARQMRKDGYHAQKLTAQYMETLCQVAPMHDIGKFVMPQDLLAKKDVTPQERLLLQSHVSTGLKMIDRMVLNDPDDLYYVMAREVVLYHHEWWNGSGYLNGLSGETIPLSARIVAVADVFDSLSSRNVGKRSNDSFEEAFKVVKAFSGRQFDPSVIASFVNCHDELRDLFNQTFQAQLLKGTKAF